jgi:hypothetical protein
MTGFAYDGPNWAEILPGVNVMFGKIGYSYETVMNWSPQMKTSRGVKVIIETPVPVGQVSIGSTLVDDAGKPRRVWTLQDAPEVVPVPSQPVLYAAASLKIEDFDITGIDVQSRFAGAFWIDVGKYCVFFAEPQPDTAYMAMASAGPCSAYVLEAEKAEDMFTITVTNTAGEPTDAGFVNISIVRAS